MATTIPFAIEDELTIYRAADLCVGLQAALAALPAGADFSVDLAGVTEMDSAGVQLLLAARNSARALDRQLHIVQPSSAVQDVFRTLQLHAHFESQA